MIVYIIILFVLASNSRRSEVLTYSFNRGIITMYCYVYCLALNFQYIEILLISYNF